jgi:glutamine transport system substrate-binding protein
MKKRLFVLSLLAGIAFYSSTARSTEKALPKAPGKVLTIGIDTSFMPFEFKHEGTYVGFDIDLIDAIAKENGWRYTLKPMDFNGLIPALQTRQLDAALAGIAIKEERKRVIDFSDPYYQSGLAALVRIDAPDVASMQAFAGKRIAAKTGTATIDWIKANLPGAVIEQFPNIDQAYMALEAKRVDVAMHDAPNVQYFAKTAGFGKVKLGAPPVSGDEYGIAFPKKSPLVADVNTALTALKADGRYQALHTKWFGQAPSANE